MTMKKRLLELEKTIELGEAKIRKLGEAQGQLQVNRQRKGFFYYLVEYDEKEKKQIRKYLSQNCNNKLHTFAPHHTCGVMS